MKVRRQIVARRYAPQIEAMYAEDGAPQQRNSGKMQ